MLVTMWSLFFTKVSNLFFIRRITDKSHKEIHNTIYASFLFLGVWIIVALASNIFRCTPVAAGWNIWLEIGPARCRDLKIWSVASSSIGAVTDIGLILLAVWAVSTLQISRRARHAIMFLFALGSLATLASIGKIFAMYSLFNTYDRSRKSLDSSRCTCIDIGRCNCQGPVIRSF
jgi:hypothetical protein